MPDRTKQDTSSRLRHVEVAKDEVTQNLAKRFTTLTGHPVQGPFLVWTAHSQIMSATVDLLEVFKSPSEAPLDIVKIAILIVARQMDSQFEWRTHEPLAIKAGVRRELIESIRRQETPLDMDERESNVFQLTKQLLAENRVEEKTFEDGLKLFGRKGMSELVSAIGFFVMVAVVLNAYEIFPAGEKEPLS